MAHRSPPHPASPSVVSPRAWWAPLAVLALFFATTIGGAGACASSGSGDGDGDGDGDKPDANIVILGDGGMPEPEPEPGPNPEPEPTVNGALRIVTFDVSDVAPPFLSNISFSWFVENATSCELGLDEEGAATQSASLPSGVLAQEANLPGVAVTWQLSCTDGVVTDTRTVTFTTLDAVYTNDFVATTQADLTQLVGITRLQGSLTIGGPAVTGVSELASLVFVEGTVIIGETAVTNLSLPQLVEVQGDVFIAHNLQVAALSAPRLNRVDGELYTSQNLALPQAAVNALAGQVQLTGGIGEFAVTYANDPASVLSPVHTAVFFCDIGTAPGFGLMSFTGTSLTLEEYDGDENFLGAENGSFSRNGEALVFSFPTLGVFAESTTSTRFEYDALGYFDSPNIPGCIAVRRALNSSFPSGATATCAGLPGAFSSNFVFGPNGDVQWFRDGDRVAGIYEARPERIDFLFAGLPVYNRFSAARDVNDAMDFRRFDVQCDLSVNP